MCNCWCKRKIFTATFSRLLFAIHGIAVIDLAFKESRNASYFYLLIGIALLFVEMPMTLKMTENGEWKWFSPMVFLYLCSIIPLVFVFELDLFSYRMSLCWTNVTIKTEYKCADTEHYSQMIQGAEELIIFVLIIGRWLMPRGNMSRDQLAQLLLLYLALGADILDILQLIREPIIKTNKTITVVGLCLFTLAVMQFTIVLTQTLSPSSIEDNEQLQSSSSVKNCMLSLCCTSEVWSVMAMVLMQDGPFLIYRLYLATRVRSFHPSIVYFICKNALSVIIQVYRVVVFLCNENRIRKKMSSIAL